MTTATALLVLDEIINRRSKAAAKRKPKMQVPSVAEIAAMHERGRQLAELDRQMGLASNGTRGHFVSGNCFTVPIMLPEQARAIVKARSL